MREWFVLPLFALAVSVEVRPARVATGIPSHSGHAAEVRRIQAHFDSVLAELGARDVASLTSTQRTRRGALLETLRAYRDRADFPHNYHFDVPTPYFVDPVTGTLCAVAHLLDHTGHRDIVDRVANADNNVWVMQLAGDAAFEAWLDDHGLTLAEAARIQVPYVGDGNPMVSAMGSRDNVYLAGTAVTVGASAATALWNAWGNADGHRRLGTILGFTSGALAMGFAGASLADRDAPRYAAPISLVSGALSTWFSTRGMLRHRSDVAARKDAERSRQTRVGVMPTTRGAGIVVGVNF